MFVLNTNKILVMAGNKHKEIDALTLKQHLNEYQLISVYPKVKQDSTYKIIECINSLVPVQDVKIIDDTIDIINLTFCNNSDEKPHTVQLDEYNKVYTMNKGYISAGNLGGQDVLFDGEGRICKILSKEKERIVGQFFKVKLRYGNNIIVNNLVVIP